MRFRMQWQATVGRFLLTVSSIEEADAETASQALNIVRGSIIAKLASLGCKFRIDNVSFINLGRPFEVSVKDHCAFINSLNLEGGLAENIPKTAPTGAKVLKDKNGNTTIVPVYDTAPAST